jgi:hypothetical protein
MNFSFLESFIHLMFLDCSSTTGAETAERAKLRARVIYYILVSAT